MKEKEIIMPKGWPPRKLLYCPVDECQHPAVVCVARMIKGHERCGTSRQCISKHYWTRAQARRLNNHLRDAIRNDTA